MLVLEVLASTQESTFVFRLKHVLRMVGLTVVKHILLEALQSHLLLLFFSVFFVNKVVHLLWSRKN